jgi:N-acetylglucosaminyldiphosphoundecaprenol N-acetyl-beta-D-mannosaminyltransferase
MRSVDILGIRVDDVTYEEALEIIEGFILKGGYHQVTTPNPEFVVYAQSNPAFRSVLNNAALSIPDGGGLLLAGRWLKRPIREQVRGTDLAYKLMERASKKGYKVFLLGAAPGVAEEAAARFREMYPGINIVGTFAGSADPEGDEEARRAVLQKGRPDIILVAYGAPKQDDWLARNLPLLDIPVGIGVGGVFDFVSGRVRRAPLWMRNMGLEWLFRLIMQPWRWRRQLALPTFLLLVLRARFLGR